MQVGVDFGEPFLCSIGRVATFPSLDRASRSCRVKGNMHKHTNSEKCFGFVLASKLALCTLAGACLYGTAARNALHLQHPGEEFQILFNLPIRRGPAAMTSKLVDCSLQHAGGVKSWPWVGRRLQAHLRLHEAAVSSPRPRVRAAPLSKDRRGRARRALGFWRWRHRRHALPKLRAGCGRDREARLPSERPKRLWSTTVTSLGPRSLESLCVCVRMCLCHIGVHACACGLSESLCRILGLSASRRRAFA